MPSAGAAGGEARREAYRAGPALPCPPVTRRAPAACFGGARAAGRPCEAHPFPRAESLSTDSPWRGIYTCAWMRFEIPISLHRLSSAQALHETKHAMNMVFSNL